MISADVSRGQNCGAHMLIRIPKQRVSPDFGIIFQAPEICPLSSNRIVISCVMNGEAGFVIPRRLTAVPGSPGKPVDVAPIRRSR